MEERVQKGSGLVRQFRRYLVRQGIQQKDWLAKHQLTLKRQNLMHALNGRWKGPGADALVRLVKHDLDQEWIDFLELEKKVDEDGKPIDALELYQAAEEVAKTAIERWCMMVKENR